MASIVGIVLSTTTTLTRQGIDEGDWNITTDFLNALDLVLDNTGGTRTPLVLNIRGAAKLGDLQDDNVINGGQDLEVEIELDNPLPNGILPADLQKKPYLTLGFNAEINGLVLGLSVEPIQVGQPQWTLIP